MPPAAIVAVTHICSVPSEDEPSVCRIRWPRISAVTVTGNGQTSAVVPDTPTDCGRFRLTARTAARFLARAGAITRNELHYQVAESTCFATGQLRFRDGGGARWWIGEAGEGYLDQPGREQLILYCGRCRFGPITRQ